MFSDSVTFGLRRNGGDPFVDRARLTPLALLLPMAACKKMLNFRSYKPVFGKPRVAKRGIFGCSKQVIFG